MLGDRLADDLRAERRAEKLEADLLALARYHRAYENWVVIGERANKADDREFALLQEAEREMVAAETILSERVKKLLEE